MKNKIYIIFITLICASMLFGCKNNSSNNQSEVLTGIDYDYHAPEQNTVFPIYNAKNQEIGSICAFNYSLLVNNSILYTKCLEENITSDYNTSYKIEYWLYDIETGEDHKLGTVDDWSYEAEHETTVIDDHMYISISTGSGMEREKRKQTIYDINLTEFSMKPMLEIESGIPYNSFTVVNNTLFLAELLENGATDIIKYNIDEDHGDVPTVHAYDEQSFFTEDSIRHIAADENHIYMVRLHKNDNENITENNSLSPHNKYHGVVTDELESHSLYMDTYDLDLNLLGSTDISGICDKPSPYSETDIEDERRGWVAYFFVRDAYFYYRNFNITTFCGTVSSTGINSLTEMQDLGFVQEAKQCDNDLFLQLYNYDKTRRNHFYLADPKTGKLQTAEFYADDTMYYFSSASRNDKGMILLTMEAPQIDKNDDPLPERLYYLDTKELEFIPC